MTKKVSLKKGKNLPLVSVIIPAHNAGKFITETIESILRQTYKNLELMIVNDGSTDNTADVIKQFLKKDKRVCWISYQMNRGESAAANLGFFVAKGDYIARMDADDIAHPERIAKQIDFLEKNPDYIVVGTQAHIIDGEGEIIGEKVFNLPKLWSVAPDASPVDYGAPLTLTAPQQTVGRKTGAQR
ncbi:MAG: Glycosyl transferase family 2 [Candidatus Pacebacteria bacterium GW2011_GWA1_46_10]|nr:MAG: Glycosyl transferase family 2 [Candidatus Pacebacteria bacterium GW2011_GWA1_46_10]